MWNAVIKHKKNNTNKR